MGGLTGHQGALRAMFLGAVCQINQPMLQRLLSCFDRPSLAYLFICTRMEALQFLPLVAGSVLSAILGVHLGKRWLKMEEIIHQYNDYDWNYSLESCTSSKVFDVTASLKSRMTGA